MLSITTHNKDVACAMFTQISDFISPVIAMLASCNCQLKCAYLFYLAMWAHHFIFSSTRVLLLYTCIVAHLRDS